ncbi:MAG: glycosyltransferase [Candidatus Pacebacteria bacterium]|jgi:glycosyltransferase involved in cell wall biosynthesis|nr:glycosyltransferase [Candidatus Paceibacterota bacterium]
MLSIDKKIFDDESDIKNRMLEYGKLFDELHIIVYTHRGFNNLKIAPNIFIYPTNSIGKLFYICDATKLGKQIIHNSKFQIHNSIITCQDPFETGFVGWTIARKFKIKLQLQVHTDFLSPYFVKNSILNILRTTIAKFLLPKADCVRVVSKRIAESLKNIVQDSKIQLLPIFIDIEKIRNVSITVDLRKKYPQFENIILMISRLEKEKNIPLAISAMKDVVKKYPKTGLVIVGDGSKRKTLKSQDSIIFDGWQNKKTIYSYYKTADLLLVTSDYEGYGMAIIEALASGLYVLSTDAGIAFEAGAQITERDSVALNIVKYIESGRKTGDLKNYPYENKQEYLERFKQSFICKKKK